MSRNPEKLRWAVEQIRANVDELREYMDAGPYGQTKKERPEAATSRRSAFGACKAGNPQHKHYSTDSRAFASPSFRQRGGVSL